MVEETVQKTNIPTLRMPFGADLPPKVPFCLTANVGSSIQPVYVSNKQIVASNANVGTSKKGIYMLNGEFKECDPSDSVQVVTNPEMESKPWIAKIILNSGTSSEQTHILHAGGDGGGEGSIMCPLLTPMWFDYTTTNVGWVRSFDDGRSYSKIEYPSIYNHLKADYEHEDAVEKTVEFTLSDSSTVTITYKECPDGHKVCAIGQLGNLTELLNDPNIGTAWFFCIDTTNEAFVLSRTKYGFHGEREYAKADEAETGTMQLYFSTGIAESVAPQLAFPIWDETKRTNDLLPTLSAGTTYNVTFNGFLYCNMRVDAGNIIVKVNNVPVATWYSLISEGDPDFCSHIVQVSIGDKITLVRTNNTQPVAGSVIYLYPAKSVVDDMKAIFDMMYPVGSVYISVGATLPTNFLGTWEKIADGNSIWTTSNTSELGTTVGGILPKHTHSYSKAPNEKAGTPGTDTYVLIQGSSSVTSGGASIDSSVRNVTVGKTLRPPALCVSMWKRTA